MKFLTFFTLFIVLLTSCTRDFDEYQNKNIEIEDFYASYLDDNKTSKVDAWLKLSDVQKHSIWKQRLNTLEMNNSFNAEQRNLIMKLNSFMTLDNYLEENKLVTYYDFMVPQLSKAFTQGELLFLFESINPYIDDLKTSQKILAKRKENSSNLKIDIINQNEILPTCDCNWMCTPTLECGPSRCETTLRGCGLFWLGACVGKC